MTDTSPNPAHTQPDPLPLSGVLRDFASRGWGIPVAVKYLDVWRGVVSGRLPAQMVGNRYRVLRSDLPTYATFLGLTPPAPTRTRKASATPAPIAA